MPGGGWTHHPKAGWWLGPREGIKCRPAGLDEGGRREEDREALARSRGRGVGGVPAGIPQVSKQAVRQAAGTWPGAWRPCGHQCDDVTVTGDPRKMARGSRSTWGREAGTAALGASWQVVLPRGGAV
ncbi:unnamed protein product [Rangifer tarandus platyrhynchus]|uniref:Uncharacterized protein n=1 Tax=Rangifer tarandus platyrhynchus TaxID=3082113 RepID=A0AC59Z6X2_RANTA